MSTPFSGGPLPATGHELEKLRHEWYWFLLLGILLIVGGTLAIGYSIFATLAVVTFFGLLLVIGGGAQIVSSFWAGHWSGFLLSLLAGILYVVVGGMMVARPFVGAEALTLLVGSFFLIGGIFRVVAAMTLRLHHWGWILLNGVITALLGLLVLAEWPSSGLFVIGLFIGIDMLFNGWMWVMLSLGLRSLPAGQESV
ncbi:MAG TPA: HdeD family acid-resistance protein [Pirellulales bacterium]|jgi:uncharacterized membrane protein HdeD (DUF308 family)